MARSRRATQFNTQGLMDQFARQQTNEANAGAEQAQGWKPEDDSPYPQMINGAFLSGHPNPDSLGIAVQGRAREADINQRLHGGGSPIGPLPDPRWQGWFQALQEAGGGKPVGLAQDVSRPKGMADDYQWWMQGDVGQHAQLPIGQYQPSNQVGTPSLNSLYRRR